MSRAAWHATTVDSSWSKRMDAPVRSRGRRWGGKKETEQRRTREGKEEA